MDPLLNREPPALRLAGLRLEISCVEIRLAAARRRARRELDAPLAAATPRPSRSGPRERQHLN